MRKISESKNGCRSPAVVKRLFLNSVQLHGHRDCWGRAGDHIHGRNGVGHRAQTHK